MLNSLPFLALICNALLFLPFLLLKLCSFSSCCRISGENLKSRLLFLDPVNFLCSGSRFFGKDLEGCSLLLKLTTSAFLFLESIKANSSGNGPCRSCCLRGKTMENFFLLLELTSLRVLLQSLEV